MTYDLSSRILGSHWSPGSGISRGRATCVCACCAPPAPAASGRSESCCWSGRAGGARGDCVAVGVLSRETSWLPGFGGGAGGVLEYMSSNLSISRESCVSRNLTQISPLRATLF